MWGWRSHGFRVWVASDAGGREVRVRVRVPRRRNLSKHRAADPSPEFMPSLGSLHFEIGLILVLHLDGVI